MAKMDATFVTDPPAGGPPGKEPRHAKAYSLDAAPSLGPRDYALRQLAEVATDWAWETDSDLRLTYLSERFEELTGLTRQGFLGRPLWEGVNADLGDPRWSQHRADFLAQRPICDFPYSIACASGGARHFRISGVPLYDTRRRFQGYRGGATDVTEWIQTEEQLAAVTARLEHLLHSGPATIYSFSASAGHQTLFVSENIRRQLGYLPEQFLEDPTFWIDHIHPEDRPRVLAELATLLEKGDHIQEYRFRHHDGTYRWMHDELRVVRDADGRPREVIGYWVDATARKEAEERLKEYAVQLERSNRELQDFAYVASHDLQEPLRKIEAFGDRLKAKCGDQLAEECRLYLDRMQAAAGRMRALINGLLTYSRVTTKAQPFQPVDLSRVVGEVVSDLRPRIEDTGGRVTVGPLPTIEADEIQMRQLLQNLIGNALKFQKPGVPPVVQVAARLDHREARGPDGEISDEEVCVITVEDNGIGFDEKYLDRIFQIFQRLHGRGEYEGTGIGLATCRKIAERHGGNITATSRPGEGATFIVTLPVKQTKEEHTQ